MSSFFRSVRKATAKITGMHGVFSGKNMVPLDPATNLPTNLEESDDEYDILSIAENPKNSIPILQKQRSLDEERLTKNIGMDNYLAKYINTSGLYSNFYKDLTYTEKWAIRTYQKNSNTFYDVGTHKLKDGGRVDILKEILLKAPKLPSTIYVYRCFNSNISLADINANGRQDGFLSTSLSQKLASKWCNNAKPNCYVNKDKRYLVEICIIIPKGTKALPFVYKYFDIFNEYEILLPTGGELVSINECHPKYNLPMYIYFDDIEKADSFKNAQQSHQQSAILTSQEKTTYGMNNAERSWNEWLQNLLKQPELNIDGVDAMTYTNDAYGGKHRKKITHKRRKKITSKQAKNKRRKTKKCL